jgi:hypothetical protein
MPEMHVSLLQFPNVYVRRPGAGLTERTLPGRLLAAMSPAHRVQLVTTINGAPPADWWVRIVVS